MTTRRIPTGVRRGRATYGSGSARELAPGKWEARLYAGRNPQTGRPVYVSRIGKTAGEARKRAAAEVQLRRDGGRPTGATVKNATISDAVANYSRHLDARVANGDLAASSRVPIRNAEKRLTPVLAVPLSAVTSAWVEDWSAKLEGSGSTRRKTWDCLRNAIRLARRDGLMVGPDPFDDVETKPTATPDKEAKHATQGDIDRVLAAADEPWRTFFTVMAYTGMRTQEVRGLRWDAVDFDAGTLRVTRDTTKSDAGGRLVPMLPEVADALQAHRATTKGRGFVFTGERSGRQLAYAMPGKVLARIAPGLNPHAFRHGLATRLLEQKVSPHIVAAIIGHADPGFTMRTYGHAVLRAEQDAMSALRSDRDMG